MKKNLFLRKSAQEQAAADYLYFQATGASTIALVAVGNPDPISMSYSTNGKSWLSYTIGTTLNVADGEKIYFRASRVNYTFSQSDANYYNFQGSGEFNAYGDLMYLLSKNRSNQVLPAYCFSRLFADFVPLKTPPTIWDRAILNIRCLQYLFYHCTGLRSVMQLPFVNLADYCYTFMYNGCTSIANGGILPAVNPKTGCYMDMFEGCTNLSVAPIIELTTASSWCMSAMFATCTLLQSAPEIKITNAKGIHNCFFRMFWQDANLSYIKVHFAEWWTQQFQWVTGVISSGVFECPSALPEEHGDNRIPTNFTRVTF